MMRFICNLNHIGRDAEKFKGIKKGLICCLSSLSSNNSTSQKVLPPNKIRNDLKKKPYWLNLDSEDHVGPPCLKSNLRPIKFSSPFSIPSRNNDLIVSEDSKNSRRKDETFHHPYSLQEFSTYPIDLPDRLDRLRIRFELEDLEFNLFRRRIEKLNQNFWLGQSERFEKLEGEAISRTREKNLKKSGVSSKDESTGRVEEMGKEEGEELKVSLDEFYRDWLKDERQRFMNYNLDWWKVQATLIKGGFKSQLRIRKWKLECLKYRLFGSLLRN